MALLLLLLLGIGCYYYYRWYTSQYDTVHASDEQVFENVQFSTQSFYHLVENSLLQKQIPGLETGRICYRMKGFFSRKREYLRVTYKSYVFDICAAPFVQDFFISWRQGRLRRFSFFWSRRHKTFYEQDTEAIFLSTVKRCVARAVTAMQERSGERKEVPTGLPSSHSL